MDGFSTITQKGQVAIPKSIRDYFNLKPFDKIHFAVENNKIVAEPVPQIEEMFGIIPAKKVLTKKDYKKIIKEAVIEKSRRKSASK